MDRRFTKHLKKFTHMTINLIFFMHFKLALILKIISETQVYFNWFINCSNATNATWLQQIPTYHIKKGKQQQQDVKVDYLLNCIADSCLDKDFGPVPPIVCLFLPSDFLLLDATPFLSLMHVYGTIYHKQLCADHPESHTDRRHRKFQLLPQYNLKHWP